MKTVLDTILTFTNWVWGIPMLIAIAGGGFFLSVRLGFLQFTKLPFILRNTIGKAFGQKAEQGKFSGWQAVTGALASTLGAGNIVGTAMAIAYGGPGGVFWLWVAGLLASIVKYAEVTMAMKYRKLDQDGKWAGGPHIYLSSATGWKWLSVAYSIVCVLCMFVAASAQIGSGVDNIAAFGAPRTVTTMILTILCALVVLGGMKNLLSVSERIVPAMSILYILGALVVLALNIQNVPGAFAMIFRYAFTGHAVLGGFGGATVAACIRWGIARGVYSNDAGVGYVTIAHSVAEVNHPIQQGMWGIFEVFSDTLIVCSMTCLSILSTGVWTQEGIPAATLTAAAFGSALGVAGQLIVTICLVLFTFTTACAQVEFGCTTLSRLVGTWAKKYGRIVMLVLIFMGGIVGIGSLINYLDFVLFLTIFFNLIGVYWRHQEVVDLSREYFEDPEKWEHTKWPRWVEMEEEYNSNQKEVS